MTLFRAVHVVPGLVIRPAVATAEATRGGCVVVEADGDEETVRFSLSDDDARALIEVLQEALA